METVLFNLGESAARLETLLARCLEAPMPRDKNFRAFVHGILMKTLGMILGVASHSEYDQQLYLDSHRLLKAQLMEYTQSGNDDADEIFLSLESSLLGELQSVLPFFNEVPVIVDHWRIYESYDTVIQYHINL